MDSNPTSIDPRARRRRRLAFTLVEFMVSMGVGSVLMIAVSTFSVYVGRSFAAMANYVDLDNASRNALDKMTKEIRQTRALVNMTSTQLAFTDADGQPLTYTYNPFAKTLSRVKKGQTEVLLRGCDFLSFSIFQRNPVGGSYDQYPTAVPETTKLINMSWVCSRDVLGYRMNSESVQTAKIVIRKQ